MIGQRRLRGSCPTDALESETAMLYDAIPRRQITNCGCPSVCRGTVRISSSDSPQIVMMATDDN